MKNNIRSAIVGAMAAIFVVALAFAPKLMDHTSTVNVHNTSDESALVEDTTTSTVLDTTTTTMEVTTTTEAPTTTTITKHVPTTILDATVMERAAIPAPPTAQYMSSSPIDGGYRLTFYAFDPAPADYPNPVIRFTVGAGQEMTVAIPADGGSIETDITGELGDVNVIQTEWDGGFLPTGKGYASQIQH